MKKSIISTLMISALFSSTVFAALTQEQESQLIEINELLRNNPDVIGNLHSSLEEYVEGQAQLEKIKQESHDWLYNNPAHPVSGNPNGSKVIVNFTDFNCPYCKRLEGELKKLISNDSEVKVINIFLSFKQKKISGIDTNAALYALNVWQEKPQAFVEVFDLLMAKGGLHNKRSLEAVAERTKTEQQLKTDSEQDEVMQRNDMTFRSFGLTGTPSLLINDQIAPGYLPYERLSLAVEQAYADN